MEILQTNITLDVYDHDGTRPSIKSIALDDNTRYVFARLTYQGELYDIGQNATVKLIIIRPDKVGAQVEGEAKGIEIWDEQEQESTVYGAYAELDQPAIAVSGTLLGQFVITSGDQILRTQIFAVNNGQALDAEEWAGQYDGYNLDELVEKVDSAVAKVDGMEADISDLKSDLSDINAELDGIEANVEKQIADATGTEVLTDGYEFGWIATHMSQVDVSNTHPTYTAGKYIVAECSEGDVFQIKGHCVDNLHALWTWAKADGTKISYSGSSSVTYEDYTKIVAPAEAKYLVSNVYLDAPYGLVKGESANAVAKSMVTVLETLNLCVDKDTSNGYLSSTGVITESSTGDKTTDFIAVSEGDVINIRNWGNPDTGKLYFGICTYDFNQGFLSRTVSKEASTGLTFFQIAYTVPEGVGYIRVSARFYGKLMITKGELNLAYLPSSDDIATAQDLEVLGIDKLRDDIDGVTGNEILTDKYVSGYYVTHMSTVDVNTIKANTAYKCIAVECEEGDIFNLIGTGTGTQHALYLFASEDGTVLKRIGLATYSEYTAVMAPANAKYFVSDVAADEPYSLIKGTLIGDQVKALSNSLGGKTGLFSPLIVPASPKFVMHRGFSTEAPENTIPAFELSGQRGAWGIETDVYETTDGYFVLSHDNDVSRMTDGTGKITEMTYAQTQECTIDAGNNVDQYPNLKMPLLEDYLAICRRYGVVPCIELKGVTHYDALMTVIRRCGMEASSVFTFYYDVNQITALRALTAMPILVIGTAASDLTDLLSKAQTFSDLWLSLYSTTVTEEIIESAHEANVPVGIWVLDNESQADKRFRQGVDFVVTNSIAKFTS